MTTDSSRAGFEFAVQFICAQNDRALFASATVALAELARIDAQPPATAAAKPTVDLIPLAFIPAGRFLMGSPEHEPDRSKTEGPQHEVTLAAFWMAKTPITQAQWRMVASWSRVERDLDPDPSHFKGDNRPVEQVSWHDAMEFCHRLSQRTGKNYTLPSEAQWEYACRAGTTTPFHFGPTISTDVANYDGHYIYGQGSKGIYRQQTIDVASFPPNAWGLHDMHGNVWEWCFDEWHDSYEGASRARWLAWMEGDSLGESQAAACCAAGRGSTTPRTAARPTATTSSRTAASTSSVSASVASPRTNSLRFHPLILYPWLLIMSLLPLPTQTLAWLKHAADSGQQDALAMLHLIARADARDQDVAEFVDSYSSTIAALCRRLDALERGVNDLPAPAAPVDAGPVVNALLQAEAALADVAEGEAVSPPRRWMPALG